MADRVHCAHILVKTEQEAKALLDQLNKGASFSKLAAEKSLCPSGKRGGDLGTFGRGQMVREFELVAFKLKKGEISLPVKTKFGWHLIRRLE
jgi:peptidyl-prolyl cis-trans isomerase C